MEPDADEVSAVTHGGVSHRLFTGEARFRPRTRISVLYVGASFTFNTAVLSCIIHDSFTTFVG